ncbi:MAG: hypothetical protein ACREOO_26220 [bacterium]
MSITYLDYLPLWALFITTVFLALVCIELGFRLGKFRLERSGKEQAAPVGAMVGATLGLLAFTLAITFGMAASRFDARKQLVLDEANAVNTAYLRAEMLPQPFRDEIQGMLREYVDVRLDAIAHREKLSAGIARSEELQRLLWKQTVAVVEKYPGPINGLFMTSLNLAVDLHNKRVTAGLRNRIPSTIWFALYLVAFLAMMAIGYHTGLSASQRSLATIFQALAFSTVLILIADLDRPQEGLLEVGQEALADVQATMKKSWR